MKDKEIQSNYNLLEEEKKQVTADRMKKKKKKMNRQDRKNGNKIRNKLD